MKIGRFEFQLGRREVSALAAGTVLLFAGCSDDADKAADTNVKEGILAAHPELNGDNYIEADSDEKGDPEDAINLCAELGGVATVDDLAGAGYLFTCERDGEIFQSTGSYDKSSLEFNAMVRLCGQFGQGLLHERYVGSDQCILPKDSPYGPNPDLPQ